MASTEALYPLHLVKCGAHRRARRSRKFLLEDTCDIPRPTDVRSSPVSTSTLPPVRRTMRDNETKSAARTGVAHHACPPPAPRLFRPPRRDTRPRTYRL
jgi:hypothetical protein